VKMRITGAMDLASSPREKWRPIGEASLEQGPTKLPDLKTSKKTNKEVNF
jgi:hypothetical protein